VRRGEEGRGWKGGRADGVLVHDYFPPMREEEKKLGREEGREKRKKKGDNPLP